MQIHSKFLLAPLVLACCLLAGCYADPMQNPGQWSMNGAPRYNLATQVADKTELFQGHGTPATSNGIAAGAAVDVALGGGTASGLQKPPKEISFSSGTGN